MAKSIDDKSIQTGVIHVESNEVHALVPSHSIDGVARRIKSDINRGVYGPYPEFNQLKKDGHPVKVSILFRCREEEMRVRLFETKQEFVKNDKYLLNPDIVHVHDTIVPFRYQETFSRLVDKLIKGELNERFLKTILQIKL